MKILLILVLALTWVTAPPVKAESAVERTLKAVELKRQEDLFKKEMKDSWVEFWPVGERAGLDFWKKARESRALAEILQKSKSLEILVVLEQKYSVGPGFLNINIDGGYEQIVSFLIKNIPLAVEQNKLLKKLYAEQKKLGINVNHGYVGTYEFEKFMKRVLANPELLQALKKTAEVGVLIWCWVEFKIAPSNLTIDINASDEEIINFLTKSRTASQL